MFTGNASLFCSCYISINYTAASPGKQGAGGALDAIGEEIWPRREKKDRHSCEKRQKFVKAQKKGKTQKNVL
jgi:hypothetical protein